MADDEQLTFRFDAEGAEKAHGAISALLNVFKSLAGTIQSISDVGGKLKDTREGLQSVAEGAKVLHEAFLRGGSSGQSFGGVLSLISSSLTPSRIAMGGVVAAAGALAVVFHNSAEAAKQLYNEMRHLSSISGLAAKDAEDLKDAFEFAGVESGSLTGALFRLGSQIETGGKELQRLGIEFRDVNGQMKSEGELLLELRDRISQLGDSTARNTALMELFGRAGRALGPAFSVSREEFQKYIDLAGKHSSVSDGMMRQTAELVKEQKVLQNQTQKINIEIAQLIGIPFEQTMLGWKKSLLGLAEYMASSSIFDFLGGGGQLTQMREAQRQADQMEAAGKAAQQIIANRKGVREEDQRLTQQEISDRQQRTRIEIEGRQREIGAEASFEAERLRIQEGATARSVDVRIRANAELIRAQEELFDKTVALEKKRSPVGIVPQETMFKLTKERDDAIRQLEDENRRLGLEQRRAAAQDERRILDDSTKVLRASVEDRITFMNSAREEELGQNRLAIQDSITETMRVNEITTQGARAAVAARMEAYRQEEDALRAFAARFPDIFEVQRDTQQRLNELQRERIRSEIEANDTILRSRRETVEKLRAEADREAGLGGTLTDTAIGRIRKRDPKRKTISQGDIDDEIERLRQEGQETSETFGAGGAVDIDRLQETMRSRGMFKDIARMGTTTGRATGLLGRQMQAQFADASAANPLLAGMDPSLIAALPSGRLDERMKTFMPTGAPIGLDPNAPDRLGAGFQKVYFETLKETERFIEDFNEKIQKGMSDTADSLYKSFMDRFVRQLEFEASRQ